MKLMNAHKNSSAAMAREVKLLTTELARTLSNCLRDAANGLSSDRKHSHDLDTTSHSFSS